MEIHKSAVLLVLVFFAYTSDFVSYGSKTCKRNRLLKKFKDALEEGSKEKNKNKDVSKRGISWPISCLHAAILKDEFDEPYLSMNVHDCCHYCEFPIFTLCQTRRFPDWYCASEAYACVFECRLGEHLVPLDSDSDDSKRRKRSLQVPSLGDVPLSAEEKRRRRVRHEKNCKRNICTKSGDKKTCRCEYECVSLRHCLKKNKKKGLKLC